MQALIESQQTYTFHLETKAGATPHVTYHYPLHVRAEPDWQGFRRRVAALHADHITLVTDAGLPHSILEPVYQHLCEIGIPCLLIRLQASEKAKLMQTALSVLHQARAHGGGTHASCFIALVWILDLHRSGCGGILEQGVSAFGLSPTPPMGSILSQQFDGRSLRGEQSSDRDANGTAHWIRARRSWTWKGLSTTRSIGAKPS